jgi:hypothetical protein
MSEVVADVALDALSRFGIDDLEEYGRALRAAFTAAPPPFGKSWYGDRYRQFASDPSWFANSLVANAVKEADGSRSLWALAARAPHPSESALIKGHAVDESRHAKMYISLMGLSFPELKAQILAEDYYSISPGFSNSTSLPRSGSSSEEVVVDELIQMNIGEIRTLIHQMLMRPVILAHAPAAQQLRLTHLLDQLARDERIHIGYTAKLIERAIRLRPSETRWMMSQRVRDFNVLTLEEIGIRDVEPGSFD